MKGNKKERNKWDKVKGLRGRVRKRKWVGKREREREGERESNKHCTRWISAMVVL